MNHGSLFSGIEGFGLAAHWMGWNNIFHCEWNAFGQAVIHSHFPNSQHHQDVTKTDFTIYRGRIDVLSGGFPCQPYSLAGKRLGTEDDRHLWPSMLRAIREIQPTWIVGENVLGIVNWDGGLVFEEVQTDLEAQGYEVQAYVLPAAGVGAPHRRDRVWFVAYSDSNRHRRKESGGIAEASGNEKQIRQKYSSSGESIGATDLFRENRVIDRHEGDAADTGNTRLQGGEINGSPGELGKDGNQQPTGCVPPNWNQFPTQSPICNGDDGFPNESLRQRVRDYFDGQMSEEEIDKIMAESYSEWRQESIKAGGNAVVPQVVLQIFKAIEQYSNLVSASLTNDLP
jgi:DNA (cytosine-5)-methyltransferase 1